MDVVKKKKMKFALFVKERKKERDSIHNISFQTCSVGAVLLWEEVEQTAADAHPSKYVTGTTLTKNRSGKKSALNFISA